jgi:hypothetical protein
MLLNFEARCRGSANVEVSEPAERPAFMSCLLRTLVQTHDGVAGLLRYPRMAVKAR